VNGDFPSDFHPDNPTLGKNHIGEVSLLGHPLLLSLHDYGLLQKAWTTPILQPFITHGGRLVFFSPLNACNKPVAEMVVLKEVANQKEYDSYNLLQPSFITQAIQLKLLHELLPEECRFRETNVMVEVLKRLDPFLLGGEPIINEQRGEERGWNWDGRYD